MMQDIDYKIIFKMLRSNSFLLNLPILIALILLSSTVFLLLQNQLDIADKTAGYAFYLLIAGIFCKIVQCLRDRGTRIDNTITKKGDSHN
jgi:hypothetical protein